MRAEVHDVLKDLSWAGADGWMHKQQISRGYYPKLLESLCRNGLIIKKIQRYNQHFYKITFKGLWNLFSVHGRF